MYVGGRRVSLPAAGGPWGYFHQPDWPNPGPPSPCDTAAPGGFLGAENQLIRVQIAAPAPGGQARLLWGYDNASSLYRFTPQSDGSTLQLGRPPVDAFHSPRQGQVVEVLR